MLHVRKFARNFSTEKLSMHFDAMLSDEEKLIQTIARQYAVKSLLPRIYNGKKTIWCCHCI